MEFLKGHEVGEAQVVIDFQDAVEDYLEAHGEEAVDENDVVTVLAKGKVGNEEFTVSKVTEPAEEAAKEDAGFHDKMGSLLGDLYGVEEEAGYHLRVNTVLLETGKDMREVTATMFEAYAGDDELRVKETVLTQKQGKDGEWQDYFGDRPQGQHERPRPEDGGLDAAQVAMAFAAKGANVQSREATDEDIAMFNRVLGVTQ